MNELTLNNNIPLTMSSQEIADLVESQHGNVRISIERLAKRGVIELPPTKIVEDIQSLSPNNKTKVYVFSGERGKRDSIVVVAQLSPKFTALLVDRWQELEARQTAAPVLPDFTDPVAAAQAWIEQHKAQQHLAQEKAQAEAALALAAPKVQALERIASQTEGAVCLRVAAKLLQMPEKQFLQFANAEGFIFRNHHSRIWQGYAEKAKAGLVELKFTTIERDDGSSKTVEQVLITRAGIAKLAERLERMNQCIQQALTAEKARMH